MRGARRAVHRTTCTWTLTSGREAMSVHAVVDDVRESDRPAEALHAVLHARFGIDHTTVQLDPSRRRRADQGPGRVASRNGRQASDSATRVIVSLRATRKRRR